MELNSKQKGIFFIIVSTLLFTLMSTCVKLSGDIPFIQKVFFRSVVGFVISGVMLAKTKCPPIPNKKAVFPLLITAVAGTCGIFGNFYAIDHMTLSDAAMLVELSPFFIIIFSALILKEKIKPINILAVFGAFIGALFIIKPTLGFVNRILPSMAGLCCALCTGIAYTMLRLCGNIGIKQKQNVFCYLGFASIVTLPYTVLYFHSMTIFQIILLLLAGLFGAFAQFAVTTAYAYAPSKDISIFDYTQLIFSAIVDLIIFAQAPDLYSFIGYFIICALSILMFLNDKK